MPREPHIAYFDLAIDGSPVPIKVIDAMLDCVVENSLHLPDVCTLRIHDGEFVWLDSETFKEGKKLQVTGGMEKGQSVVLFRGEIAALELDLAGHGVPTIVVRAYSRAHRLHRGRYSRSFQQMTDSDIFKKVAQEAGFSAHADSTSQVHNWVFQNNQTNWEFLSERAAHNGFRLYLQNETDLYFKKVKDTGDGSLKLEWGMDLRSFRPRTAATPQVDEVVVRGWDPKLKKAIVGTCKRPTGIPQIGDSNPGGQIAGSAFGAAKMVVTDRPVHSQGEAEDLARSICDDIGGEFLEAEGLCYGRPSLHPGMDVEIRNIGKRFSGKYFVTATTHTYTSSEGFSTLFSVSGKRPSTLIELIESENAGRRTRLGGNIVVGVVTDNLDPDNLGRVKVQYPWLTEEHTSYWARIAVPMAGPDRGFYFLPEIDDEVLVAFEHGDIRRPYVVGALWNGKDKPVEGNSKAITSKKVNRRTIKTRIGHTLLFDDTDGKGEVSITTSNAHKLVLDDKNKNITAKTTDGHTLLMDDQNKNITLKTVNGHTVLLDDQNRQIIVKDMNGSNKITIASTDNSMKLECMGNFTVQAQGQVKIEGQLGVEVSTPMQLKLSGTMQADLESSTMVQIQGAFVKIN